VEGHPPPVERGKLSDLKEIAGQGVSTTLRAPSSDPSWNLKLAGNFLLKL
jgi:hypothetical protein